LYVCGLKGNRVVFRGNMGSRNLSLSPCPTGFDIKSVKIGTGRRVPIAIGL